MYLELESDKKIQLRLKLLVLLGLQLHWKTSDSLRLQLWLCNLLKTEEKHCSIENIFWFLYLSIGACLLWCSIFLDIIYLITTSVSLLQKLCCWLLIKWKKNQSSWPLQCPFKYWIYYWSISFWSDFQILWINICYQFMFLPVWDTLCCQRLHCVVCCLAKCNSN